MVVFCQCCLHKCWGITLRFMWFRMLGFWPTIAKGGDNESFMHWISFYILPKVASFVWRKKDGVLAVPNFYTKNYRMFSSSWAKPLVLCSYNLFRGASNLKWRGESFGWLELNTLMLPLRCNVYSMYMLFKCYVQEIEFKNLFSSNWANVKPQLIGTLASCWHHDSWLLVDFINIIVLGVVT